MIVMKFGGASVGSVRDIKKVKDIILSRTDKNPVVVFSAMAKTTRSLLETAKEYAAGNREKGNKHLQQIKEFHLEISENLLDTENHKEVTRKINDYFSMIINSLNAIFSLNELSPRSSDSVLCFGELLSTLIIEKYLSQSGINSKLFDSRNIIKTDSTFTKAVPDFKKTTEKVSEIILPSLNSGFVPVIQGFIGSDSKNLTTTLGFEGSDYTAAITGSILNADIIEIWKKVQGIMSCDPCLVKNAVTVRSLTFPEAEELTFFGAKVLHPSTVLPAKNKNIPISIKNTEDPEGPFTLIKPDKEYGDTGIKSVTLMRNVVLLKYKIWSYQDFYKIQNNLDRYNIQVIISEFLHNRVETIVRNEDYLESALSESKNLINIIKECALITAVGTGIEGNPEIPGKIFSAAAEQKIRIISFFKGDFSIVLSVKMTQAEKCVKALHKILIEHK